MGSPSSAMSFAVGPLTAFPPMIGDTARTGAQRLPNPEEVEDRVDAQKRVRRADYYRFETFLAQHGEKIAVGPRLRCAFVDDFANDRHSAEPHKVVLEVEPAGFGAQPRANPLIAHRQDPRGNSQPQAKIIDDRRQAFAREEAAGALDVRREIPVAELKPSRTAERLESGHEAP